MKKIIALGVASLALLISASGVFAGAKNATYLEWFWNNPATPGGGFKSAFFMKTGSGIIHGWTYNHPDLENARFIYKPLTKFENTTECDEGWVRKNPTWNPDNLYNAMKPAYKDLFWDIFDHDVYLFCAYPMD